MKVEAADMEVGEDGATSADEGDDSDVETNGKWMQPRGTASIRIGEEYQAQLPSLQVAEVPTLEPKGQAIPSSEAQQNGH